MARLVENSGDEFPDVQELLKTKGKKQGGVPLEGIRHSRNGVEKRVDYGYETEETKKTLGHCVSASEMDPGVGANYEMESPRKVEESGVKKMRKRVLKPRDYNPLLRRIETSKSRRGVGLAEVIDPVVGSKARRVKEQARRSVMEETKAEVASEENNVGAEENHGLGQGDRVNGMEAETGAPKKQRRRPALIKSTRKTALDILDSDEENVNEQSGVVPDFELEAPKMKSDRASSRRRTPESVLGNQSSEIEDNDEALNEPLELDAPKLERSRTSPEKALENHDSEDEDIDEESDGLSDFIVNDSSILDEEDSEVDMRPPRSARRLVKGRRPQIADSSDTEDLDLRMRKLTVDEDIFGDVKKEKKKNTGIVGNDIERGFRLPNKPSRKERPIDSKTTKRLPEKAKKVLPPSSDIEDPFTLRFSPSENKPRKVSKQTYFVTPPGSPEPKTYSLTSPKKFPRIPATPHRESMDAFWSQEIVNDWNDEYSPRKITKPTGKTLFSPKKSPVKPDRISKDAKRAFSQIKHDLAESFLKELDNKISDGQIAKLSESTGGVKIIWSKKLNTTAGRANWKRETLRSASLGPSAPPTYRHHASIELAEKVIDDEDRLLNVIAHEFCHLTNFMISNIKTNPHGKEFKTWASKCSREFGNRGIEVTTKHSYQIDYKYVWECTNCGTEFKRHSKSIDTGKHQCGVCKSKLVQTKPVPRNGEPKISDYQVFVKENMKNVREENPGSPQKEIMRLVGKRYQELKKRKEDSGKVLERVIVEEVVASKEGMPDDGVGLVVRKLDFLDLTSP